MKPLIGLTPEVENSEKEFSQRGSTLSVHYTEAIRRTGGVPVILPLTTERAALREFLRHCAGILIPGGGDVAAKYYEPKMPPKVKKLIRGVDDARDEMELFLIREALDCGKPIFGICRGIQIMNVAAGGTLVVDIPTQVNKPREHRRKGGGAEHEIALEPHSRLHDLFPVSELRVNSSHHQAVGKVGAGFRVTARAADGVVEALEREDHPFAVGVQFHPERMFRKSPTVLRLFEAFVRAARGRG